MANRSETSNHGHTPLNRLEVHFKADMQAVTMTLNHFISAICMPLVVICMHYSPLG